MLRLLLLLVFFFASLLSGASNVLDIGILTNAKPTLVQVIVRHGSYRVVADGKSLGPLKERVMFKKSGDLLEVSAAGSVLGRFRSVEVVADGLEGVFDLHVLNPGKIHRVYDDNLRVEVRQSALQLVNEVSLEKYVAGVVEAETGKGQSLEFYKVQAIISRTYALSNRRKHLHEGFNLNDLVDCQVYHGKSRWDPKILEAVAATEGMVLTNSEMKLITAAFHSNSGGQTVNCGDVWSRPLPYLSGRKDEFSLGGEHATWTYSMPAAGWLKYLKDTFSLPVEDQLVKLMALNYEQKHRQVFFLDPGFKIPLLKIRRDLGLNSTLFDLSLQNDTVTFTGRGFGHGIGLSQEGAMRMADLGFSHVDILHYYYNSVHIVHLKALKFFQEE